MIGLIEYIYKIVKGYMLKEAEDTGNMQFVAQLNTAFTTIESIWAQVKTIKK